MSLNNIKSKLNAEGGFTIVELLIVVVVIAILAAITIVSYNGITGRANESAVKAQAATYQKKAELYQSEIGYYPLSMAAFDSDSSKSYYVPEEDLVTYGTDPNSTALPSDSSSTKRLLIQKCAAVAANQAAINDANISGLRISFYNSNAGAIQSIDVGDTSGVCPTS